MVKADLTAGERQAAKAVAGLVGTLGVVGFAVSATNVAAAVEPSFGQLAWTVPFGVDVGIAAFTGLDLLQARMDARSRWLRLVPWALIAVTVYLNVAQEPDLYGQVAHAVLPLTWVIAVEAGAHMLRTWAGLHTQVERMDRVRRSRWVLAPLSTLLLWRRMVLWEERSYLSALSREQARLLALCDLQEGHGRLAWRWKAPRRERALYRLGELVPAPATAPSPPAPAVVQETAPAPTSSPAALQAVPDPPDGGQDPVEAIAEEMHRAGERVTRRSLAAAVRSAGHQIGTGKAARVAARYT